MNLNLTLELELEKIRIVPLRSIHITMSVEKNFLKSKSKCKVLFQLPVQAASGGSVVKVVGDFNDWEWKKGVSMKIKNGKYIAELELPLDHTYQFRYLIDDREWENDWNADDYVPTEFGVDNSVVDTHIEETVQGLMHFCKN